MLEHRLTITLDPGLSSSTPADQVDDYVSLAQPFVDGTVNFFEPNILPGAQMTSLRYPFPWKKGDADSRDRMVAWMSKIGSSPLNWDQKIPATFDKVGDEINPDPAFAGTEKDPDLAYERAQDARNAGIPTLLTASRKMVEDARPELLADDLIDPALNGEDLIDTLVVNVTHLDHYSAPDYTGNQRDQYSEFMAAGNTVWSYQSCNSHGCSSPNGHPGELGDGKAWPTLVVDSWAVENRAEPWLAFLYGALGLQGEGSYLKGIHYYDVMAWSDVLLAPSRDDSPFGGSDLYREGGQGEGILVYPGSPEHLGGSWHFPLASVRLKQIRAALEEIEWLLKCAANDAAEAEEIAAKLFSAMTDVTADDVYLRYGGMYDIRNGRSEKEFAEDWRQARIRLWYCADGNDPSYTSFGG